MGKNEDPPSTLPVASRAEQLAEAIDKLTGAERVAADRAVERQLTKCPAPKVALEFVDGVGVIQIEGESATGTLLLSDVFASVDNEFVTSLVAQLYNAGGDNPRSPGSSAFQAMISTVKAIGPRDEIEALLAVQATAVHFATMQSACRLSHADARPARDAEATLMTKLARTFTAQIEALKRHRASGEQKITVQHVHVADGGQAVVAGTMSSRRPGAS